MSSFAALMALSATQTRQSEAAVQSALAEKQRREAQKRKELEEKERKEREMETKLRLKRLEEEKREQERQARQEREREARDRELKRREEEERSRLLHGPKKGGRMDSNGYPVSRVGRRGSDDSDDDGGMSALTREEKRKRRMELEMRHGTHNGRRANASTGYGKAGRRLPGGAVDITTTPGSQSADGTMSIRQRLAQAPTLIKLNVNKRDTRTIDEILQDRAKAKAKTLEGDEAKEFKDWFGRAKETKAVSQDNSTSTSRANTPAASGQKAALSRTHSGSASPASKTPGQSRPLAPLPSAKGSASSSQRPSASKFLPPKTPTTSRSKTPVPNGKAGIATSSKASFSAGKPIAKKRQRSMSDSRSPSPAPPPKKRLAPAAPDFSSEIWKLFGKDRSRYVAADVMSDDEDMEAGASDLEREELRRSVPHHITFPPSQSRLDMLHDLYCSHLDAVRALLAGRMNWLWKKNGVMKKRSDASVRRRSESISTDLDLLHWLSVSSRHKDFARVFFPPLDLFTLYVMYMSIHVHTMFLHCTTSIVIYLIRRRMIKPHTRRLRRMYTPSSLRTQCNQGTSYDGVRARAANAFILW